ncbi:MAG: UDP-N-acetylmuramoyl-tripeptide--D-alanyl-D-alanine ligase [Holophagales bacterium]|nr:UDP-N-acetylmuramoyl-tripeptide--D-alanyl-D-alanine ligase [Holophagales bacterium]
MVERPIRDAVDAMHGRLLGGDASARWRGAVLDSRRIRGGELFFALPGQRVDGHRFAAMASERGAAGVVIHQDLELSGGAAWIRVDDTFQALHALTRAVRRQVPRNLVGITGSAGKTTTKELLSDILARRFRVAKSPGNFNNLYGFPIALLGIPDDTEWMVAEMGMSTPRELAGVSRLGRPEVAVYTNIRPVHLASFSSLEAIADAKSELLEGLAEGGLVVANADDPHVMRIVRRFADHRPDARILTYGLRSEAEYTASEPVPLSNGEWRVGCRFELRTPAASRPVELAVHGLYNVENFLAAATCCLHLGVPLDDVAAAAAAFQPSSMRGEVYRLFHGPTVIDDSYNSNPDAAARALESARVLPAVRRVAILGDMLELGPGEDDFHRQVGRRASELGFDHVVAVGELASHLRDGVLEAGGSASWQPDAAACAEWLGSKPRLGEKPLGAGDLVLVKGSRSVGLETAVAALRQLFPIPQSAEGGPPGEGGAG